MTARRYTRRGMSRQHPTRTVAAVALAASALLASCSTQKDDDAGGGVVIESPPGVARPPYRFSARDEALLEEVQRGAFNWMWATSDPAKGVETGMCPDRTSKPTVSIAGVGFQLSGLCVGVERGWITREQGRGRAELILRSLAANPENRKAGLFYHFIDPVTAGQPADAYERVVSTIDSALLFAGVITASSYFGGDVARLGDALFRDADWRFFVAPRDAEDPQIRRFVTLGWKPEDAEAPTGKGSLLPYGWVDSGDEHRLVTFLGVCAPRETHRLDAAVYYRLRRQLGGYPGAERMVWFPWSGALFAAFFANCWIDYAGMGPDNPSAFTDLPRARVDWWENSRRTMLLHRAKAVENPLGLPGFGENGWGLSASDVEGGYAVPGLFPDALPMQALIPGSIPVRDYTEWDAKDDWGDGTIAPYAAGCCVMFDPAAAVAALRHMRGLRPGGDRSLWSDPASGGFGFQDAYNERTGWVAPDCVAIDQGPLLLAIENARTGLIWRTFHAHRFVRGGMERLGMQRTNRR